MPLHEKLDRLPSDAVVGLPDELKEQMTPLRRIVETKANAGPGSGVLSP